MKKWIRLAGLIFGGLVVADLITGKFSFQGSPVSLPASPISAFRIVGNESDSRLFVNDPNTIQGYSVVQRQPITDPQLQKDIVALLNSSRIYGMGGAHCFEPGMALRFGKGSNAVDVLICLGCEHAYFFNGGKVEYRDLNSIGITRIKSMYSRLFPGHVANGEDEDTALIKAAREKECGIREWGPNPHVLPTTTATNPNR